MRVFGEVYVWTSGFSNYMPPVWMSLVILFRRYHRLGGLGGKPMKLAIFVSVFFRGTTFASVSSMAQARDRHIRREIDSGATEVVVFALPYRYTAWDHLRSLRHQYRSEQNVSFHTITFESWMDNFYQ